jgi:RNA polymerase sigma-70 factor (ECF subfamily)
MVAVTARRTESDWDLAQAVIARDRKASADFVRLHTDAVQHYVWRRLAPRTEAADDLVQEIMLAAWANLRSYTGEAPLAHWIVSVARHKVNDYYRSRLRYSLPEEAPEETGELPDGGEGPELQLDRAQTAARAARVLEELREDYALLLRWRYWDGFSAKEMAAETGRSEKSIERMLARARREFGLKWTTQEGGRA